MWEPQGLCAKQCCRRQSRFLTRREAIAFGLILHHAAGGRAPPPRARLLLTLAATRASARGRHTPIGGRFVSYRKATYTKKIPAQKTN